VAGLRAALWDRRIARASGLALGVYLLAHVMELTSSLAGREAFAARAGAAVPPWVRALVLVPLGLHAARSLRRVEGGAGAYRHEGLWRIQRLAGLCLLAFLVVHLGQAFVPARLEGQVAVYDRLAASLSLPLFAGVYVLGLAAAALHLAQGLEAVAAGLPAPRARALRAFGLGAGALVFVLGVDVLSHFTSGRALFAP